MEERIRVLIAELDGQWKEILKIHGLVEKKTDLLKKESSNEDLVDSLAYKLHNLYSAYEDMFKLISGFFENQINGPEGYHTNLLKRMTLEIEGIRPAFLSEEPFVALNELRGFRHVFRHAYSYKLDAERVLKLAEKGITLKNLVKGDFELFKGKLRSL